MWIKYRCWDCLKENLDAENKDNYVLYSLLLDFYYFSKCLFQAQNAVHPPTTTSLPYPAQPNAPYLHNIPALSSSNTPSYPSMTNTTSMTPGQAYPGLAEYMGMELSEAVIRDNMPEYLANSQVLTTFHHFCYFGKMVETSANIIIAYRIYSENVLDSLHHLGSSPPWPSIFTTQCLDSTDGCQTRGGDLQRAECDVPWDTSVVASVGHRQLLVGIHARWLFLCQQWNCDIHIDILWHSFHTH